MDQSPSDMTPLLGEADVAPVTIVNAQGRAQTILLCDHAANAVPSALHGLGLAARDLVRHIAWDIGAAAVVRRLSARLDAPAVLSGFSRLVIDCNRRPGTPASIVMVSDGVEIPGNRDVAPQDALRRAEACFWPYHRRIGAGIAGFAMRGQVPAIVSIHSFTPVLGGVRRPWQVGVLWDRDARIAGPLIETLRRRGDLVVGDNEPYSGRTGFGYSIEVHAIETGLPNVLIELREDLIADEDGQTRMADLVADALAPILADPGLYRTVKR